MALTGMGIIVRYLDSTSVQILLPTFFMPFSSRSWNASGVHPALAVAPESYPAPLRKPTEKFTVAREEDVMFNVIGRMSRKNAAMVIVFRVKGRFTKNNVENW